VCVERHLLALLHRGESGLDRSNPVCQLGFVKHDRTGQTRERLADACHQQRGLVGKQPYGADALVRLPGAQDEEPAFCVSRHADPATFATVVGDPAARRGEREGGHATERRTQTTLRQHFYWDATVRSASVERRIASTACPKPCQAETPLPTVAPMDGSRLGASDAEEFFVAMADGSRHRYVRTERRSDRGVLYEYLGRE
jgi:hypothetical protein